MKRTGYKVLLGLVSTFLALGLAECLLRAFVEQQTKRLAAYDHELGWRGRPNGTGLYIRSQDNIRQPFSYNNYGFNDADITPKSSTEFRVAILGDSMVEGLEVPRKKLFHQQLEMRLKQELSPRSDVVAVCSQGYSSAQQVLAYKKFRHFIRPDVVITAFYSGNDFEENLRKRFAFLDENGALAFPVNDDSRLEMTVLRFKRWLYESSHLVFFIKNRIEAHTAIRLQDSAKSSHWENKQYKNTITCKLISEIHTSVEKDGAQHMVLLIPSRDEVTGVRPDRLAVIREYCSAENIPYLDLTPMLTPHDYFTYDRHFTIPGHAKTAKALFQFLSHHTLIPHATDKESTAPKQSGKADEDAPVS